MFEVIHNATHSVGSAGTFREARAILAAKSAEAEASLRRLHPGAEVRVSGNRDSSYIDALSGGEVAQREFYRIEEVAE